MLGPLTLAAHIARSSVVGTQLNVLGERQLCYESGLAFLDVRAEERVKLADILEWLTLVGDGSMSWQEVREYPGPVIWGREVHAGWWAVATTALPADGERKLELAPPSAGMILPAGYESHMAAVEAAKGNPVRERARRLHQLGAAGSAACVLPRAPDGRSSLTGATQFQSRPD